MEDQSTLNTSSQPDSTLCNSEYGNTSLGDTLNYDSGSVVKCTQKLLTGALFIVSSGTEQNEDIPRKWYHPVGLITNIFGNVAKTKDHPKDFFSGLIETYSCLYNIDLRLIVRDNGKYVIIDKSNFLESNKELYKCKTHAFIWCNDDNTPCSPLYILDVNGHKRTVFETDEVFAEQLVESLVNKVNQKLLTIDQNQIEQHLNVPEDALSHMAIDNTSLLRNDTNSLTSSQPKALITADIVIEQLLAKLTQVTNYHKPTLSNIPLRSEVLDFITNPKQLSPKDFVNQCLMIISETFEIAAEQSSQSIDTGISTSIVAASSSNHPDNRMESNGTNYCTQTGNNSVDEQLSAPTHLSDTTPFCEITQETTARDPHYDAPQILIEPKQKWHPRSMKDLGKEEIPLLAGEGPQRTPIQVTVPPEDAHQVYLCVKTVTHDDQSHHLKIIVPEYTKVNMNNFCNDNNLDRLQFGERNSMNYCDRVNKCICLLISSEERNAQKKHVRIHMFNLYQSGSITREMIRDEQLNTCKLAFWLCILEDNVYIPVSSASFSKLIQEH